MSVASVAITKKYRRKEQKLSKKRASPAKPIERDKILRTRCTNKSQGYGQIIMKIEKQKSSILQITVITLFALVVASGCALKKVQSRVATIYVTPSTATISHNGSVVGTGSYTTTLTDGYYSTFNLSADGYESQTATISYSDYKTSYNYTLVPNRRTISVSVTPNTADIRKSGSVVGTGNYQFTLSKGYYQELNLSAPNYLSKTVRIDYSDNQSSYNFSLEEDQAMLVSVSGADIANKWMRIAVRKDMSREQALKSLKYYITDKFETLEVNDNMAGWVRTAWTITKFNSGTVRTRLEIKEVPDDGSGLSFKFFIASQYAELNCGPNKVDIGKIRNELPNEECFKEWDRILKIYVKLYADMSNAVN